MGEFEGRVALVTGGALGIGQGIVRAFAREGAAVAIADVRGDEAAALAAEITGAGGRAVATIGDVASASDAERMVAETVSALGRLDVLVNNAGIMPPDWYLRVEDLPEEAWDRTIGVNLKGVYLMSRFAIPRIREGAWPGSIVNISSVQGLQSMPRVPAYSASKGGVLSLTQNMALDYASEGIRVNAICPGTIDTHMVRTLGQAEGGDIEATLRHYGSFHPLGRIGTPADIGEAVLFMASPRASFITGEHLCVDGGFMAQGAWATSAGAGR
jgi:NAD(P)-dependent dehydrogenase (short-subunit alcohol dehydrogenase family)